MRKFLRRLLRCVTRRRKHRIIIIYPNKPLDNSRKYAEEFAKRGYISYSIDYGENDFKLNTDEIQSSTETVA